MCGSLGLRKYWSRFFESNLSAFFVLTCRFRIFEDTNLFHSRTTTYFRRICVAAKTDYWLRQVHLKVSLSVCLSVCPTVSVRPCLSFRVRPSVRLSVCSSVRLSAHMSVCLYVCPYVCSYVRMEKLGSHKTDGQSRNFIFHDFFLRKYVEKIQVSLKI